MIFGVSEICTSLLGISCASFLPTNLNHICKHKIEDPLG